MLKAGETFARDHGADVRNGCDAISRALQRVARAQLISSLSEKLEEFLVLRFMDKDALNPNAILTRVLAGRFR